MCNFDFDFVVKHITFAISFLNDFFKNLFRITSAVEWKMYKFLDAVYSKTKGIFTCFGK